MNSISLIIVPYHTGIPDYRVGAGPKRILANGLVEQLKLITKAVTIHEIGPVDEFEGEIGRSFEIIRRVADAVASASRDGSFPIVLAGNCNVIVGVAAGMSSIEELGVIWFDAHADLDTPDEAVSGYFDGMGVSMLTGESWKALMATVPGHRPLPLHTVIYCGVRDLSNSQRQKLEQSPAKVVYGDATARPDEYATRLGQVLDSSATPRACLVHLDLDCLDIKIGHANEYAAPGGLNEDDLLRSLDALATRSIPVGLTVASFNPHLAGGNAIADVAVRAITHFMRLVENRVSV